MNTEFILRKLQPFLNEKREISEAEFIHAFGMLRLQEQYEVIQIMIANNIEYVEYKEAKDEKEPVKRSQSIPNILKTPEEIKLTNEQLCVMYQGGDENALEWLLSKNEPFVFECAQKINKYFRHKLGIDDLVQEGKLGLIKAAKNFDVKTGYKFLTYAWHDIRQHIQRSIVKEGFTIRFPAHVFEKLGKINKLERQFDFDDSRILTDYLFRESGFPEDMVRWLLTVRENIMNTSSLNQVVGEDTELANFIPSYSEPLEDEVIKKMIGETLRDTLDNVLSDKERFVIIKRFGLDGDKNHTLEEIGDKLGLTRERIRQIEQKSLRKLREKKEIKRTI